MRTLCDVCEAAPARLFCAADEAALCPDCDDKVHGCNKLASRHVRVELAEARAVPRCDICENAPAFFYCGIDGTSLCLQCDMDVHIDGKKTHERYLLMGQRVKLPSQNGLLAAEVAVARPAEGHREAAARQQGNGHHLYHHHQHRSQEKISSDWNNSNSPAVAITVGDEGEKVYADVQIGWMIDLNSKPQHLQSQSHVMKNGESSDPMSSDDECVGVVPQLTAREVMEASSA